MSVWQLLTIDARVILHNEDVLLWELITWPSATVLGNRENFIGSLWMKENCFYTFLYNRNKRFKGDVFFQSFENQSRMESDKTSSLPGNSTDNFTSCLFFIFAALKPVINGASYLTNGRKVFNFLELYHIESDNDEYKIFYKELSYWIMIEMISHLINQKLQLR